MRRAQANLIPFKTIFSFSELLGFASQRLRVSVYGNFLHDSQKVLRALCQSKSGVHTYRRRPKKNQVHVGIKGQEAIVAGTLCGDVRQEDAVWSIEDKRFLQLTLEKRKKT
jgi:hypothetical protein